MGGHLFSVGGYGRRMPTRRTPLVLLVVVLAVLVWSAIGATKPLTWALETIWAVVGVVLSSSRYGADFR